MAGRQGKALADADLTAGPVPIEKPAEFEMDVGRRLCAEKMLEEKMDRWEYLEELAAKIAGQQS